MGTQTLLLVSVVIVQFCNALGRHNFYEYYYSRHHKGHSTSTESIFLSTSDILTSSEHEPETSPPVDNLLQNNIQDATDDTSLQNNMYEPTVYSFDENYHNNLTKFNSVSIGLMVGGVVIFLCFVSCVSCCIFLKSCTRKERRGFVIANQGETAREVVPQQIHQPPEFQQPYPTQRYEEWSFPPQYQPHQAMQQYPPMQPQFQSSPPAMQSHNPPEAPPPYEFPQKF